jgi:hypothetical protein
MENNQVAQDAHGYEEDQFDPKHIGQLFRLLYSALQRHIHPIQFSYLFACLHVPWIRSSGLFRIRNNF